MSAGPEQTEPAAPAPPTSPAEQPTTPQAAPAVTPSMAGFGGNESCPNCGSRMAADQRYCLNCGHRRGDPRLPFMDAVVFMETMSAPGASAGAPPPPPSERSSSRMNANAALIAGVATLVLAIGVGFLIGRSGHENNNSGAAAQAPIKVIEVGAGGNGGEVAEAGGSEEATAKPGGKETSGKSKGQSKLAKEAASSPKATKKAKENSEVGEHGASKATEEVLHTEGNVKLAEPEQKVGGSCEKGTAGCGATGKFEGNFFGE